MSGTVLGGQMMDQYRISESLWVDWSNTTFAYSGLFYIVDGMGGKTLVDVDEIPALIEALQKVKEQYETTI